MAGPLSKSPARGYFKSYLLACPRAIFFTLRFFEPRGYSRGFLGACFLRAVRLAFLRSSLLSTFVSAIHLS